MNDEGRHTGQRRRQEAVCDEEGGRYFGEYGGIQEYHLYGLTDAAAEISPPEKRPGTAPQKARGAREEGTMIPINRMITES